MTTAMLAPPAQTQSAPPWRALPILLLGAFLPVLDAFIVNIALATIGRTLDAGPAALELTVSGYGVAYACTLVAGGRLGDRFGRRRLLLIGMAAFTITSAACGLAPTPGVLIAFRVLQGFAAALMFPQVLASIQALFTGADRQRALGAFGAVAGTAAAVGQLLGGTLLAADLAGLSWRPIFLVNVPIGIAALFLVPRLVPETRAAAATRIDIGGALMLAATIALLLMPLTLGHAEGWPLWTIVSLVAVVPALAGFFALQAARERHGRMPLLPPSLLRLPLARRALLAILIFAVTIGGLNFTIAITMQVGHHIGPLPAGLAMVPCALVFLAVSLRVARWVTRYGAKVLALGALILGIGFAGFGLVVATTGDQMSPALAAVPLAVTGFGWAMVLAPLIGFVMAGLPAERAGLASGTLSTAMQVGLAIGASVIGSLLFSVAGDQPTPSSWRSASLVAVACVVALAVTVAAACVRLDRR